MIMKFYCKRYGGLKEFKTVTLTDEKGNLYQAYRCECLDGSQVCQKDKYLVDHGVLKDEYSFTKNTKGWLNRFFSIILRQQYGQSK